MKKIQGKIFIDIQDGPLPGGPSYDIETYDIGQVIHFNDTGNEFYHKTDGVWEQLGGNGDTVPVIQWISAGPYQILPTDDIVVAPNADNNLTLPDTPIDEKPIIIKNLSNAELTVTSTSITIDNTLSAFIIPAKSAVTIAYFAAGTNWVIESDYTIIPTVDNLTITNLNGYGLSDYQVLETDDIILSNGNAVGVLLPNTFANGKEITVKNLGTTVTGVVANGLSVGIDLVELPYELDAMQSITLVFDSTSHHWYILSKYALPVSQNKVIKYLMPGDYTVLESDDVILIGNLVENIYLPTVGNPNKQYVIKNLIDVSTNISIIGGAKFDEPTFGRTIYRLDRFESVSFFYNATFANWSPVSSFIWKDPVIKIFTDTNLYDLQYYFDIVIANGASVNFNLPTTSLVIDGKQITIKNVGSTDTSIHPFLNEMSIENMGLNVPYILGTGNSITLVANKTANRWEIVNLQVAGTPLTLENANTLYNKVADNTDPFLTFNTKDEVNALLKAKAADISPIIYHSLLADKYVGTISTSGTTVTNNTEEFDWDILNARIYIGAEFRTVTNLTDHFNVTVDNPFSQDFPAGTPFTVSQVALQFSNASTGPYASFEFKNKNGGLIFGQSYDRVTVGDYKLGDGNNNCAFTPGSSNAFQFAAEKFIQWYSATSAGDNALASTADIGLRRNAAGVLEVFDGVTSNNDGLLANRRDLLVRTAAASNINLSTVQETVTGSTGGDMVCSMPFMGATYKKIVIYVNSLSGVGAYLYPMSFTYVPAMSGTPEIVALATPGTDAVAVTAAGESGFLILEGF